MDKQLQQNRSGSFNNTRAFGLYKQSIPEKKISNDLVIKLFSEVSSGNYMKLKDFLLQNQLTMSSRTETGDSVLHMIIENSNITEREKIQLINFAIKEGAPVNLSNENNVSPLHLACKNQLYDVVSLLIENGSAVDYSDSQFKTPLHYSIIGESTQCLNENDIKVKPLIPKSHVKTKEISNDIDISQLQTALKNFLVNDPRNRKFIVHIKNTFDDIEKLYPTDFEEIKSSLQETIASTIVDKSINDDKLKIIFEKVTNDKKKILDFIIGKARGGVQPLEIKPSIYEGWGPNQYQANRILKYRELSELLNLVHSSVNNEVQSANTENIDYQDEISNNMNLLKKIAESCSEVIQHSHYYCTAIGRHIGNLSMSNFTILQNYLFTSDPTQPIDSPILQCPGKIYPSFYNLPIHMMETYIVKTEWDPTNNIESIPLNTTGNPATIYMTLRNMRTLGERGIYVHTRKPRITKEEEDYRVANKMPVDEFELTVEQPMRVGSNFLNPAIAGPHLGAIDQIQIANILTNGINPATKGVFFDTKAKILIAIGINLNTMLKRALNELSKYISEKKFNSAYIVINECLADVLSISMTVSEITKEIPILNNHFNMLKELFNSKYQSLARLYPTHIFLIQHITEEIDSLVKNYIGNISVLCDNIYSSMTNVVRLLNKYLLIIQKSSVATIFDSYYKSNDFDTWYNTQDTNLFDNMIVDNPIETIPNLPINLIEFKKLQSESIVETKRTLINNFISQISLKNLITFYVTNPIPPIADSNPTLGFIQLFANRGPPIAGFPLLASNPDPNVFTPMEAVRKLNPVTGTYTNDIQIKELRRANPAGTDSFNNPNIANLIGFTGLKNSTQKSKSVSLPSVIGLQLDTHLVMIRYSIVRRIITQVYEYLDHIDYISNPSTRPAPPIPTTVLSNINQPFREAVDRIKAKIESLVPFDRDNYSFLFVLIGKYMDEIIVNIITELINNKINKILLSLLEDQKRIPQSYIDKFNKKIIFPNKDLGFSVNMEEIFQDILGNYTNAKFIMNRKNDLVTAGNLNDAPKKELNVIKLINFNYAINSIEKICFKVNPKIISLLLKKGANLNSKDSNGNTPLYYAIEMQNKEVIDLLLSNGAVVYNQRMDNKFGKSILDSTWENYGSIVNTLMVNKYSVCETLTNNLLQRFSKQGDYKNNIPKYSNILLSVSLYMLNHQLYTYGKGYPMEWTFSKNEKLENLLQLDTSQLIPLLDSTIITDTEISRLEIPNLYIRQLEKTIEKNKNAISSLRKKKQNLINEQRYLTNLNSNTDNDISRLREIVQIDADIQNQIHGLTNLIDSDEKTLNKIQTAKNTTNNKLKNFIEKNKNRLMRNQYSAVETYESIFKNVINFGDKNILNNIYDYSVDVKTYPMIWKKFMDDTKNNLSNCKCQFGANVCKHDYTQILDNIFCYQQSVILENRVTDIKLNKLDLVIEYYENVINSFATDYFDLPKEYGHEDNYALSHVIDIIVHIVKRFVCVTFFGAILKGLSNFVVIEFPYNSNGVKNTMYKNENEYQSHIINTIINVINDNGDGSGGIRGSRLLKYIFDVMPLKLVKVILQIFSGPDSEFDPDRQLSIEQIFDHVNKILESTTALNLYANNSLTSGLKLYVYPYYGDYLELFVKEIYNLMTNYLRSLQFQSKALKILQSVSSKAMQEMKRQI